jgi:adenylate cyclase class 2
MKNELEVKILDIDKDVLTMRLRKLGAKQLQDTKLEVYWFGVKGGLDKQKWYLRIRKYSDGKIEVTWKGKSKKLGVSRTHKEINFLISDFESMSNLFKELGLVNHAFQEKYRTSWQLKDWRFDLDTYPGMPPYLEIEGTSEKHIQEAIKLLGLENHKTWNEGEKTLIMKEYKLNWSLMKF